MALRPRSLVLAVLGPCVRRSPKPDLKVSLRSSLFTRDVQTLGYNGSDLISIERNIDMSDNVSQQPDGFESGSEPTRQAPRLQVEPTEQRTAVNQPYMGADPTGAANNGTAQTGAAGTVPPATETIKHTVVKTKTKKAPLFVTALAGCVVGAILVIALVMSGAFQISDNGAEASSSSSNQTIKINASDEDTTLAEAVSAKCLPSVVSITTYSAQTGSVMGQQGSSSDSSSDSASGVGSGVVLDTDGNILTNYHVIEDASSMSVSMNGENYEAEVVGSDSSSDLAVIKLKDCDKSKLTPIEVGDSSSIAVGEWVMAIGSPFGNEQSVSTGIVSSLYRSTALTSTSGTSIYANMIQTDAAINPGNSGGALVNSEGKLIGINSIIESYSGSSSGVGFAIPANYAVKIAKQIIAGKTPVHAYLGVTLGTVTAANAQSYNLSVTSGAYVAAVTDDSPAAEAGLEKGDVVTKLGDEEITSADSLIIGLRSYDVGDKVTLTFYRGKDEKQVEVTLGSDEDLQSEQSSSSNSSTGDNTNADGGGNGLSQDQLRQYLEELLGGNSSRSN